MIQDLNCLLCIILLSDQSSTKVIQRGLNSFTAYFKFIFKRTFAACWSWIFSDHTPQMVCKASINSLTRISFNFFKTTKSKIFATYVTMESHSHTTNGYRVPKCDIIKFSFLHFSIFMTKFKQNMMKNPHTPNMTWIGSWWPEIWPHEYLISPTEISVNWPGSKQLWTRPIYTDFNGAN